MVTITGLYLGDAVAVAFGGTPATTFTVVDDYNITATVGDGKTGPITVTTPGGTAVSAMEFTYLPTPQITSYVELAKDFLPITQSISALTDYGAGLSSDGTNYVPIFNKPNGTWSWQLCEDNQTQVYGGNGLWYWYGLGTYTDTSPYPSITMMDSGFWYPSMNTTVMNGIVAARRSLPGNLAYDDPATAQQGVPYQAWSLSCNMALLNWGNNSGVSDVAYPYWEIDDNAGNMLANLEFEVMGNGIPFLTLNGVPFISQPGATFTNGSADAIQHIVVVPGSSQCGDHAGFSAKLTLTGFADGTVTASILDAIGNTWARHGHRNRR